MFHVPTIYPLIMFGALAASFFLLRPRQTRLGLTAVQRFAIGLGAFCGGMLGAKLPFAVSSPAGPFCSQAWITDGKTLLFGLVGGYVGVEVAKWLAHVRTKTGDSFAVPLAVAIGIGRFGCFAAGCCHGVPTSLPWGIDFGDGLPRHPTQLYEAAFHLLAALVLLLLERRNLFPTQRLKLYLIAYCLYRFLSEFVRPEIRGLGGLTNYQWGSLILIPAIAVLWWHDRQLLNQRTPRNSVL